MILQLFGTYSFNGEMASFGRQSTAVIDARMPNAQARVDSLRSNGFECRAAASQAVRCTRFRREEIPASSMAILGERHRGFSVTFGELRGEPELILDARDLREWSVPQSGRWEGGEFRSYRLREMRGGSRKIALPGHDGDLWLNLDESGALRYLASVRVSRSANEWDQDTAELILRR